MLFSMKPNDFATETIFRAIRRMRMKIGSSVAVASDVTIFLALAGSMKRTMDVSIWWFLLAIKFCSMDPLTICGFAFNVGSVKRHLVWKSQSF
jgi:hypothetical protein